MDSSSMEGLMMTEINADDWEQDSTLEAPRDARSYELLESDVDIVNNRIQLCKASLQVPNTNRDESLYSTFSVSVGARVYQNKEDTAPVDLGMTQVTLTIDAPAIDYDNWEPTEGFGDIEREAQIMQSVYTENEVSGRLS